MLEQIDTNAIQFAYANRTNRGEFAPESNTVDDNNSVYANDTAKVTTKNDAPKITKSKLALRIMHIRGDAHEQKRCERIAQCVIRIIMKVG